MPQEYIEIHGARENNLKNVSLRIPKRKITIFTGVSGSGKSSIVFDTIATEAQRQLYETFSMFVRNFLPRYAQPQADSIENLDMAIVVDQKRLGGGSHSTVGTITDISTVLRLLFSRVGKPFVGYSNVFSFNDPQGMCPECSGLGRKLQPIVEKFYDPSKSLREGAIQGPVFDDSIYMASGFFDNDKKLSAFTKQEMDLLLYGQEQKFKIDKMNRTYLGVITGFTLSGGESQRVKIVKHLSSSLMNVTYIFDEPSIGLHPRDVHRLTELLQKLRDKGNTVMVVEHDPDVIKVADPIVDVGPHAGSQGGEIVYEGTYDGLLKADTLTGQFMKQSLPIKKECRQAKQHLKLSNVTVNNLK